MKIKTAPEDMIVGPTSPARSDSSSKNSGFSSSQTFVSLERQLRVCWTFAPQAFLLGLYSLCSKPAPRQSSCLVCVVWRHVGPSQAFVIEYAPARFVQAWWKMHPCRGNTADGLKTHVPLILLLSDHQQPNNKCSQFFKSSSTFVFHHLHPHKKHPERGQVLLPIHKYLEP